MSGNFLSPIQSLMWSEREKQWWRHKGGHKRQAHAMEACTCGTTHAFKCSMVSPGQLKMSYSLVKLSSQCLFLKASILAGHNEGICRKLCSSIKGNGSVIHNVHSKTALQTQTTWRLLFHSSSSSAPLMPSWSSEFILFSLFTHIPTDVADWASSFRLTSMPIKPPLNCTVRTIMDSQTTTFEV